MEIPTSDPVTEVVSNTDIGNKGKITINVGSQSSNDRYSVLNNEEPEVTIAESLASKRSKKLSFKATEAKAAQEHSKMKFGWSGSSSK